MEFEELMTKLQNNKSDTELYNKILDLIAIFNSRLDTNETWDSDIPEEVTQSLSDKRPDDEIYYDVHVEPVVNDYNDPPAIQTVYDICTNSTHVTDYYDLTQIPSVRYIFIIIYVLVIAVSFVGNFMVIWTVTRNRHMRTVTNYYIRNLAVCDFLVAGLVMPLKLLEYTAPCSWQVFSKDALCSVIYYILPVFVFASVLTLVAISLERCHAIVYPLNSLTMHSKTRTRLILLATWLIPIIVASPYTYCKGYAFSIQSPYGIISRQICTDRFAEIDAAIYGEEHSDSGRFRKGFFIFISIAMYMVPMIVIVTTCIRIAKCLLQPLDSDPHEQSSSYGMKMTRKRGESKRRVARMIITVAIAFIVCWTPFYLVSFISQVQPVSFLLKSNFIFTMLATHLFGFLNSAINPFIYHFMSEKFRKSFTIMARSLVCWCPENLWQKRKKRNQRHDYSWAMKCEEYYCQHRLQKQQQQQQQHSSSSHSHSKNDFGGQMAAAKFKNNIFNEDGSSTSRNNPNNKSPKSPNTSNQITRKKLLEKENNRPEKDVTIFRNKRKTSLYCGPFCVCHCQDCSQQSSSSSGTNVHHVKPYAGIVPGQCPNKPQGEHVRLSYCKAVQSLSPKDGKQDSIDTLSESSFSLLPAKFKKNKGKQEQKQAANSIQLQPFSKHNGNMMKQNVIIKDCRNRNKFCRAADNCVQLTEDTDSKTENNNKTKGNFLEIVPALKQKKAPLSCSDSYLNIYSNDKQGDKISNGVCKSSISANHLQV